jgi:integrase
MPEHLRAAVLPGAFAGLRVAEVLGLRLEDVDFLRAVLFPKQQFRGQPPKTEGSCAPVPIPRDLVLMLSASVQQFPGPTLVTNGWYSGGRRCRDTGEGREGDQGATQVATQRSRYLCC